MKKSFANWCGAVPNNGDIWDFSWLKGRQLGEGLKRIKNFFGEGATAGCKCC